jgi:hypothetical protein
MIHTYGVANREVRKSGASRLLPQGGSKAIHKGKAIHHCSPLRMTETVPESGKWVGFEKKLWQVHKFGGTR